MSNLIGISSKAMEPDDVIRKIRRLSVVLDTSVKEMEQDLASPPSGEEVNGRRRSGGNGGLIMDYRSILVKLQEQKPVQDDRRLRLR